MREQGVPILLISQVISRSRCIGVCHYLRNNVFKPLGMAEGSDFIGKVIQLHDTFKAPIARVHGDHGKRNLLQVAEVVTVWRHESVVRMLPEHPESSSAESGPKEFLVPHVHNMSLAPKRRL